MTVRTHAVLIGFALVTLAGCGGDEGQTASKSETGPTTVDCEPPELLDFKVNYLEADNAQCSTAGAVASSATDCYFQDFDCPDVTVGGTRWDCAFQLTGPSGSGGRSRGVCFASGEGRQEVRFEVERVAP